MWVTVIESRLTWSMDNHIKDDRTILSQNQYQKDQPDHQNSRHKSMADHRKHYPLFIR